MHRSSILLHVALIVFIYRGRACGCCSRSSSMDMLQGCFGGDGHGGGDGDWYSQMMADDFTALPFRPSSSSSSPSPLILSQMMAADFTALPFCPSSSSPSPLVLREEDIPAPAYQAAPAAAADDLYRFSPFPAPDLSMAGLDDELLMQGFSDIDLDAFAAAAVEPKLEPDLAAPLQPISMETVNNHGATVVVEQQLRSPAARRKSQLDHVGLDELRNYFYMPITTAAREMDVGLTALKRRCRELGVARWPHRKMKSLRALIANMKQMPSSSETAWRELERCCEEMEEDPTLELTLQTKKLRQACFKENYKRRRREAAMDAMDAISYNGFDDLSCQSSSSGAGGGFFSGYY